MKLPFLKQKSKEPPESVSDVASDVLLHYLQNWGQTTERRGEALIRAGRWCGFNCELTIEGDQAIPQVGGRDIKESEQNLALWKEFRAAIERCWPIGSWEQGHGAIQGVMWRFRERIKDGNNA